MAANETPIASQARGAIKRARSFGITVGSALVLLGVYLFWRGRSTGAGLSCLAGAALVLLALARPGILRRPSDLWWGLAHRLGWFNTRVLLLVMFFLVLLPVGLVRRLLGHDPMGRRLKEKTATGWVPFPARYRDRKHYERMY